MVHFFGFIMIGMKEWGERVLHLMGATRAILAFKVELHQPKAPSHEVPPWMIEREHPTNHIVVRDHDEMGPMTMRSEGEHGPDVRVKLSPKVE